MARSKPAPERLAAWLDGELPASEAEEFERLLEEHPEWREEAAEQAAVRDALESLAFTLPPATAWDGYWDEIEPRLKERRWGWLALGIGGLTLAGFGTAKILLWAQNPVIRVALALVIIGLLTVFFSVLRGHLLERPNDRYRNVKR